MRPKLDRRLRLVIMPRTSVKRKRPPAEFPSSISLEVISVVRTGNRFSKKRVVEATKFNPRASPIPLFEDDLRASTSQADSSPPLDGSDAPNEHYIRNASRSVSVSVSLPHHVVNHRPHFFRLNSRNGYHTWYSTFTRSFV